MERKNCGRRNLIKGVGSISLSSLLLSSRRASAVQTDAKVSEKTARKIAKKAVVRISTRSEFSVWSQQGVRSPQLFHAKVQDEESINYIPRAWVFPIEDRGENVGYITIDAEQTEIPVLAYGKSKAPQRRFERTKKIANSNGGGVRDRFLYHGGTEYCVETYEKNKIMSLRSERTKKMAPVEHVASLRPTNVPHRNDATVAGGDGPPDWSGDTDDEISGVPNWTESDDGGASDTDYGPGPDSWIEHDGCVPIAQSMVIGYHEGIEEHEYEKRETLIDRLHVDSNTDDSTGETRPDRVDNGVRNYSEGQYSYSANNRHFQLKGNVEDGIANNNPLLLNMVNGPYNKDEAWDIADGHSVTVVGYRSESCGMFCNNFYHKVYNGEGGTDQIVNGNWARAFVTRIQKD